MPNPNTSNQEYKGTGRLVSAIGGWSAWGFVPSVIAGVMAYTRGFTKSTVAVYAVGLGSSIYGAVRGWNKASAGEAQFNELQIAQKEIAIRNEGLQTQVVGLNREIEGHRKFSDNIQSRANLGSHAAAHEVQAAQTSADIAH